MKCKLLTYLIFLLPVMAWAAQTEISSLPYTASQTGTNYSETLTVAGTNLTSTTNGINLRGHDMVFMLGNDTISIAVSDSATGSGSYGLWANGDGISYCYNIIFEGGVIIAAPTDTNTNAVDLILNWGGKALQFNGTKFIIESGFNAQIIYRASSAWRYWNWDFDSCRFANNVSAYTSRCQFDGAVGQMWSAPGDSCTNGDNYSCKFTNCVVEVARGGGFNCRGKYYFDACSLTIDNRNDYYTFPSGNACWGTTNSGAIIFDSVFAGSYIKNCYITADTVWDGTDIGIMVQRGMGTAENPIVVCSNYVEVFAKKDANYGWMNSKACKTRRNNSYVNIFDNVFKAIVGDSINSEYGPNCVTVDILACWDEGNDPDSNVIYERNEIWAIAVDSLFELAQCARFALMDSAGYSYYGAGNRFQYNSLHTPNRALSFSPYDNYGSCNSAFVYACSTDFDSLWANHDWQSIHVGFDLSSVRSVVQDHYYSDGDKDTSISFQGVDGYDQDVSLKRTWSILVLDTLDNPVEGAIVKTINNYGDTVGIDTAGADGWVAIVSKYWQEFEDATDSTGFNPFDYFAYFEGDTTEVLNFTLEWDAYTDTVVLAATGEPPPPIKRAVWRK